MVLKIRFAEEQDKTKVLEFTAHTWEQGDYIQYVWDDWLHSPHGKLFTAELNAIPVGIMHIKKITDTIALLEGARVDPNYRGQGIGTKLTEACIEYARTKGFEKIRLVTAIDNTPARTVAERLGFGVHSSWLRFDIPVDPQPQEESQCTFADSSHIPEIMNFLENSDVYRLKCKRTMMPFFEPHPLTYDTLLKIGNFHVIICRREGNKIDAVGILFYTISKRDYKLRLYLGYLDGNYKSLLKILDFVKYIAFVNNLERISAFAAFDDNLKKIIEERYNPTRLHNFLVYELSL